MRIGREQRRWFTTPRAAGFTSAARSHRREPLGCLGVVTLDPSLCSRRGVAPSHGKVQPTRLIPSQGEFELSTSLRTKVPPNG